MGRGLKESAIDYTQLGLCLFEESSDALFIVHPSSLSVVDANPRAAELTGQTRQKLLEMDLHDLIDGKTQDALKDLFESCSATRLAQSREAFRLKRLQGNPLDVNLTVSRLPVTPTPLSVVAVRDVSGRRAMEAELRKTQAQLKLLLEDQIRHLEAAATELRDSEQRYRTLFEDSQDAILLFNADCRLETCNRAARDLFVLTGTESLMLSDIFHGPEEATRFQHELQRVGALQGAGFRARRRNTEAFDAIVSVNPYAQTRRGFDGYQVIVKDVSDWVELERRLSDKKKMEAIGQMASGIAHDFNNFLTVVMLGAELIKTATTDDPTIETGVQIALDGAQRARDLVSQLQTFSSNPDFEMTVIDLHDLLASAPELLKGLVPDSVRLTVDLAEDLGHVFADPNQIQRVITNLVVNACDAMPLGGELCIRARNERIDVGKTAEHHIDAPGDYVLIQVQDTGEGMDSKTCDRVFEPFFTTKSPTKGTGLGLAIVYGIIQQSGGGIRAMSSIGKGTVFEICLPITSAH